ncbi:MAG: YdiY family protein [bacterium]|jgi:putative salt-induced outer membrane protein YdiY|nr:DUF481 domain-containing protein [Phycisphaerales bacterium]MCE2653898.1 DUF481 domain-containing protein [Planctomycetaceae bacterium]
MNSVLKSSGVARWAQCGMTLALVAAGGTTVSASTAVTQESLTLSTTSLDLLASAAVAQAAKAAEKPEPTSFSEGWKSNVDVGLTGSDGNSESLNIRGALGTERITKPMETRLGVNYTYASSGGDKSKSRGEGFIRNDWNFNPGPWSIFGLLKAEYDEFQPWDWRVQLFAGPGFRLIDKDNVKFKLRAGAGLTREIGDQARNEWLPEANFGFDYENKLTERQKIFLNFDYYPSLKRFTDYRHTTKAGWEILVDPEVNMSLKIGAENRYNSKPGGNAKKNDIDYFIMLSLAF